MTAMLDLLSLLLETYHVFVLMSAARSGPAYTVYALIFHQSNVQNYNVT